MLHKKTLDLSILTVENGNRFFLGASSQGISGVDVESSCFEVTAMLYKHGNAAMSTMRYMGVKCTVTMSKALMIA